MTLAADIMAAVAHYKDATGHAPTTLRVGIITGQQLKDETLERLGRWRTTAAGLGLFAGMVVVTEPHLHGFWVDR